MSGARGADALIVVGDWISEHYFSPETKGESFQAKVVERRRTWDASEHPTPAVAAHRTRAELETRPCRTP